MSLRNANRTIGKADRHLGGESLLVTLSEPPSAAEFDFVVLRGEDRLALGRLYGISRETAEGRLTARIDILAESSAEGKVERCDQPFQYVGKTFDLPTEDELGLFFAQKQGFSSVDLGWLRGTQFPYPLRISAAGFGTHSALVGQSRSGKSFALGRLVEELAGGTEARVLVIDPNGDFNYFPECKLNTQITENARAGGYPEPREDEVVKFRRRMKALEAKSFIFSEVKDGAYRYGLTPADCNLAELMSVLGYRPVRDPGQVAVLQDYFSSLAQQGRRPCTDEFWSGLGDEGREVAEVGRLMIPRINPVWNTQSEHAMPLILRGRDWRFASLDVSSLSDETAQLIGAMAIRIVFEQHLSDRKLTCTFIVVDEAHHLFPESAVDQAVSLYWGRRIAAEGRKYGVFFILATQQPGKLHPHVFSQLENLFVMRMTNEADIQVLRQSLASAPSHLAWASRNFEMGECLVSGKLMEFPIHFIFGVRRTVEGGKGRGFQWAKIKKKK